MQMQIILVGKQIILVGNDVTLFLHKDFLEQTLYFLTSQLGFQEAATMPVISEILTVHASLKWRNPNKTRRRN